MDVHELMAKFKNYERSLDLTGYRDGEFARGRFHAKAEGDSVFYEIDHYGNAVMADAKTGALLGVEKGPCGYLVLEGREASRYLPFRVVAVGTARAKGGKLKDVLKRGTDAVAAAEAKRRERFDVPPVFPSVVAGRETAFHSSNGFEFTVRPTGKWKFHDSERRFYGKDRVKAPNGASKDGAIYEIVLPDDRFDKLGGSLKPALDAAMREFRAWFDGLEVADPEILETRVSAG